MLCGGLLYVNYGEDSIDCAIQQISSFLVLWFCRLLMKRRFPFFFGNWNSFRGVL